MHSSFSVNPIDSIDGTELKESADLVILRVTFDAKMTFEKHLCSVSSAAAQRLGITKNSWQVFHHRSLLLRSFWSFVLPVLEYCSAVWCSAADSHLKLLDRVVRSYLRLRVTQCIILAVHCLSRICSACYSWCFSCSKALVRASSL